MSKRFLYFWFVIVFIELVCIGFLGYRYYQKTGTNKPKKVHVLPIDSEYLQFSTGSTAPLYSEPKANIQKQEDLSLIGMNAVIYHTFNADGLNERFDYPLEKEKGVFRIISLGDSFTEGAFVATENNYSEVLEDILNDKLSCPSIKRFEVINLGVEGYDMQYNVERFIRKGKKYNPDLVLLWTNDNDYTESNEKIGELSKTFDPLVDAPDKVEMYKEKGDYYPALTVLLEEYFRKHSRSDLIKEELGYLRQLLEGYTGPMIIFSREIMAEDIKKSISDLVQPNAHVHFYPEIPDSYDLFPDQHPSVEGHRQFAHFLFTKISALTEISCVRN